MHSCGLSARRSAFVYKQRPSLNGGQKMAETDDRRNSDPEDFIASEGDEIVGDLSTEGSSFLSELVSPLNIFLIALSVFLLYKIIKTRQAASEGARASSDIPILAPMKKQDLTLSQLREYNGVNGGRILIAVNGKVFDVTKGRKHYGPGGPYGVFAGRDASRGLGTFSLTEEAIKDTWDDLSDLRTEQMESIREWEMQFTEKYDLVGRLLNTGEEPTDYTDTEEELHTKRD